MRTKNRKFQPKDSEFQIRATKVILIKVLTVYPDDLSG